MATKTKTVNNFEGYTQVFGNFAPTDIIEVIKTSSPKKSGTQAAKAYERMLDAHKKKDEAGEKFTVADSVTAGNVGYRIKWDANPDREFVRVWRKTS